MHNLLQINDSIGRTMRANKHIGLRVIMSLLRISETSKIHQLSASIKVSLTLKIQRGMAFNHESFK